MFRLRSPVATLTCAVVSLTWGYVSLAQPCCNAYNSSCYAYMSYCLAYMKLYFVTQPYCNAYTIYFLRLHDLLFVCMIYCFACKRSCSVYLGLCFAGKWRVWWCLCLGGRDTNEHCCSLWGRWIAYLTLWHGVGRLKLCDGSIGCFRLPCSLYTELQAGIRKN